MLSIATQKLNIATLIPASRLVHECGARHLRLHFTSPNLFVCTDRSDKSKFRGNLITDCPIPNLALIGGWVEARRRAATVYELGDAYSGIYFAPWRARCHSFLV